MSCNVYSKTRHAIDPLTQFNELHIKQQFATETSAEILMQSIVIKKNNFIKRKFYKISK